MSLPPVERTVANIPHVQKLADAEGLEVTPLYALPPDLAEYLLRHLRRERADLDGFLRLGNEQDRAKRLDAWIACLAGPNAQAPRTDPARGKPK